MWQKAMKKLENLFTAVTFAQAGEFDAARQWAEQAPSRPDRKPAIRKPRRLAGRAVHAH